MKISEPTFLRRFQIFATFRDDEGQKQSEPVDITLGFRGPVNAESGMILNLTEVDSWIRKFEKSISKNTYVDRWDFCKSARRQFQKQISSTRLTQLHFEYHDLFVKYFGKTILFGWKAFGQIKSTEARWLSPVKVTLKAEPRSWPPLTTAQALRWRKRINKVDLNKKWLSNDAQFYSFEYTDRDSKIKIRIT